MNDLILVIDDEEAIVTVVKARLLANNYSVITAVGGIEGIEKAIELKPALIILDIMMPDLDGYSFVRRLKEPEFEDYDPMVILLTGKERVGEIFDLNGHKNLSDIKDRRLKDLFEYEGVKDYLMKPFVASELLDKVRKYMGQPGLTEPELEIKATSVEEEEVGFETVNVYLAAVRLVESLFDVYDHMDEKYRLVIGADMVKSAVSIVNNMAKGYRQFEGFISTSSLDKSYEALREVVSFLFVLEKRGTLEHANFLTLRLQVTKLEHLIHEEQMRLIG